MVRKRRSLSGLRAHAAGVLVLVAVAGAIPGAAASDGGFRRGRLVVTDFDGRSDRARRVATLPDGRIVVSAAVSRFPESSDAVAIARFHANGARDTSFAADGRLVVPVVGDGYAAPLLAAPGGKIVIVDSPPSRDAVRIRRLLSSGSLDRGFGGNGTVVDRPFVGPSVTRGFPPDVAAVQPDGKIVLATHSGVVASWLTGPAAFAGLLVRYQADGDRDPAFGRDGRALFPPWTFPGGGAFPLEMAIQDDGAILVAGQWTDGHRSGPWISRFRRDGSPDTSFGIAGTVRVEIAGAHRFEDLEVARGGRIMVLASGWEGDRARVAVARLGRTGALDPTFGRAGVVRVATSHEWAPDLSSFPSGGFAVALHTFCSDGCARQRVAVFDATGAPDASFGARGVATVPMREVSATAWSPRGLLVAGDVFSWETATDVALARLKL